jgi:hypothetical protein
VNPGVIPRWAGFWGRAARDIHFTPQTWMSASLLSFVVAAVLTVVVRAVSVRAS